MKKFLVKIKNLVKSFLKKRDKREYEYLNKIFKQIEMREKLEKIIKEDKHLKK